MLLSRRASAARLTCTGVERRSHRREITGGVHAQGRAFRAIPSQEPIRVLVRAPSGGSRGDLYTTVVAESMIGLYKAELSCHDGPGCGFFALEYATLECVAWFSTQRLLKRIGERPPGRE